MAPLCALLYLGTAVHFALVEHATCAAHGELVHAGAAPAPAAQARHFADARLASPEGLEDPGHGAEAHCSQALPRRELLREGCESARPAHPLPARVAVPAARRLLPEPVARLHLAPKASPPPA
ncbi:MAG TPA: hypothetical protein VFO83_02330 [Aggregicoccus sp.]|nr:hypothetical protein [Aggregicoccus sp.]